MIERPRKHVYQSVADLCLAIKQLSFQSYRFQQSLSLILDSACGVGDQKGILYLRTNEYCCSSPIEWAKQMDELRSLFDNQSFLMNKIKDHGNNQTSIEPTLLPKCVLNQFPQNGAYESRLIGGLKKDATGNYSIKFWEWFWIKIIKSFMEAHFYEKRPLEDDKEDDQFFFNFSRNFYLGFFQRILTKAAQSFGNRVINLLHLYLIEELFEKYKKRDSKKPLVEVKYKLKPHYLYVLYLLILTNSSLTEETVKIYYEFMEKIAQNYSSVSNERNDHNIRNLIRVWITLATRSVTFEKVLLSRLELANQEDGWFRLGRCPIDKFEESLKQLVISNRELSKATHVKESIIKLLDRYNQWPPSFGMLAIIQKLLAFQSRVTGLIPKKDLQQESEIVSRALERILIYIAQQSHSLPLVSDLEASLNKKMSSLYNVSLRLDLNAKMAKAIQNKDNGGKNSSYGNQRVSVRNNSLLKQQNVWDYPLQHNEFLFLYKIMYWIAEIFEKVLPGKQQGEHPRLNLRIMANPLVFLLAIIITVAVIRWI